MSVGYRLVNYTRREVLYYTHIGARTAGELVRNPAAAAVTTWYLLENPGDDIAFVSFEEGEWPFPKGTPADLSQYKEVCGDVVDALIQAGHLEDHGIGWADENDPDTFYVRDLRPAWTGWGK